MNYRNNKGQFIKKYYISKELLWEEYINKKRSQTSIAKDFGCSQTLIRNLLIKYCIQIRETHHFRKHPEYILNNIQMDIINGSMLGDGYITKTKKISYNSQFIHTSKHYEYENYIHSFLDDISKTYTKITFDKRINKISKMYSTRTINDKTFSDLRIKWYENNKKIIPPDLILNPKICLIWYMDDGSLLDYNRTQYIKLSTHCFAKSDIESILFPQLKSFEPKIRNATKNQYFISIPRRKISSFLKYIGISPVECMLYKWYYKEYKYNKYETNFIRNTNEQIKDFKRLYKKGWTCYKIAKKYGIEPNNVRYYLIKDNIYNKK